MVSVYLATIKYLMAAIFINITREKLYNKISYGGFYNAEIYITKRFISRKGCA